MKKPKPDSQTQPDDTIAALATPAGKGAIAIIRLSGPGAVKALSSIWQPQAKPGKLKPGQISLGWIAEGPAKIDQALVLYMAAPHSYTGEDVVEIHTHGSPAVVNKVLSLVLRNGVRLAQPGEFSMRAYLNGQIDLVQAEAVADLVDADNERLARLAAQQLAGGISRQLGELKDELVAIAAEEAAQLDFGEEDITTDNLATQNTKLQAIIAKTNRLLEGSESLNVLRTGYRVALLGLPNAGKSTLLNSLLGYDRSIVTSVEGTTRDTITETVVYDGLNIHFTDTAGLRQAADEVESKGVERTLTELDTADLVLILVEPGKGKATRDAIVATGLTDKLNAENCLVVQTKQDVSKSPKPKALPGLKTIKLSAKTGDGLPALLKDIHKMSQIGQGSENILLLTQRQVEIVSELATRLEGVAAGIKTGLPRDVVQAELQGCAELIGSLTGSGTTQEVIDSIFSRFCVGK